MEQPIPESGIISNVENFFDQFGLMRGEYADKKRFIAGALIGGFVLSYLKPDFMFHNGKPRSWSFTSENDETSTPFTFYHAVFTAGLLSGVFI